MTGLRKFNKTVDTLTVALVGRDAAHEMKRASNRLLGIKRRGRGLLKRNAK